MTVETIEYLLCEIDNLIERRSSQGCWTAEDDEQLRTLRASRDWLIEMQRICARSVH